MAYGLRISVIFTESAQTDTLEKCLLSQGVQCDIAAGDSLALTGPTYLTESVVAMVEGKHVCRDQPVRDEPPATLELVVVAGRRRDDQSKCGNTKAH